MPKLHMIIADEDEAYVEGITKYITNNYSQRFQVTCFTEEEYLFKYFLNNKRGADILLISPEWYSDSLPMEMINTPIILSKGVLDYEINDWEVINKYQVGNKLVSSIINCFAERNPDKYYTVDGEKKTHVIAVYSPIGGCGKTTITVGASIREAENGKAVFYLNLEDIQSIPYFFNCETKQNLSNMLYYIKEKKKNITLKIEGIRCVDFQYNIHYFSPPDSIIDLNETSPDEIQFLLNELKAVNNYDTIFVDMSSKLDDKNISILKASDQIMLIINPDDFSMIKTASFMKELEILSKRNKINFNEKITIVLNKYSPNGDMRLPELNFNGKPIAVKVPIIFEPFTIYKDNYRKELKPEYKAAVDELLRKVEEKL